MTRIIAALLLGLSLSGCVVYAHPVHPHFYPHPFYHGWYR